MATLALCLTALATTAQAQQPPLEKVVVRAEARFAFDADTVSPADRQALLAEVGRMQGVSWQTVTAVGHTDSVGTPAYNQQLAARRAAAVKDALVRQGLPAELVQTAARGPANPVADNASEAGRARNRRTEVVFEGVRSKAP
ncbi:hypothetical protein AQPW35_13440 [Rubrivivax pictus]|uniref:OmpA-like domain-containing protein n=2 Tax=Pseudaquabacterium pictum TaxID=2315236 RepID=A0A480ALJ1_9BURK|nr:hypothetical protein AQPW35_13440 [Rubrivivax pictus]